MAGPDQRRHSPDPRGRTAQRRRGRLLRTRSGCRSRSCHRGRAARPVADGRPEGFCKLIADRRGHTILGAHVVGEYSAETVQTVAAAMAAGMTVEQIAELQLAYPTFTEGVSMAAQKICRTIGIGRFPQAWSYLGPEE